MTEPDELEFLAASLRADARDLETFVEVLADKLEGSLPQRTQITRRSARLLSRQRRVRRLTVSLGEDQFSLERTAGGVVTRQARSVRGIILKNEVLDLDAWIDALAHAIAQTADAAERGRLALGRLLAAEDP